MKRLMIAAFLLLSAMLPAEGRAMSDGCICWQFEKTVHLAPHEIRIDRLCLDMWLGEAGATVSGFARTEGGFRLPVSGTATFVGVKVAMTLSLARFSIGLDLNSSGAGQAVFYDPSKCWKTVVATSGYEEEEEVWKCGDGIAWQKIFVLGACPDGS